MSQPRTSKRVRRTPTKLLESVRLDLTLSSSDDDLIFQTLPPAKAKSASKTGAVAGGSGERSIKGKVGVAGGAGGRELQVSRVKAWGEGHCRDSRGGSSGTGSGWMSYIC